MLHNPLTLTLPPPAWPTLAHQPPSHGASPSQRTRHVARWHPYDSGNSAPGVAGMTGLCAEKQDGDRPSPGLKRRLHITIPRPCIRTRSLTDIHSNAPTPSPLRQSAIAGAGQVCESLPESAHLPGTYQYPIQTPATIKPNALRSMTPSSGNSTPISATPTTIQPSRILVTPASVISPISPVRERGSFGRPMTHGQVALGATPSGAAARSHDGDDDDDAKTEIGSPEEDMDHEGPGGGGGPGIRLPPIQTLPPMSAQPIYTGPITISQDLLLYGPAGLTPAPAELQRNNVHDKLPPVPAFAPARQATFFGIQNVPVADGNTRFATMCAPGIRPTTSTRAAYPPAGLAPLVAGHQGLPHGGLTAPIERGDEATEWKERQRAKERADIVVKDGELTAEERVEMEKRISMSVKVINHIYYGADEVPKTRSPTTSTRRLSEDDESMPGPSVTTRTGSSRENAYWPPTPASMPSSPESPRTRRGRQRASLRKEVLGIETVEREEEQDPSRDQPARTLIWFVTEVLRRSRTSINVLQVALAYLAGAKPEIHKELRAAADCQADLALKIAGLPAHIREALPGMDWMGGDFTPSPLIDPRRTFLASLVLASKFLLDKAFSNKAWAKLSGLEALEVGKCERALGSALNWRLWVGREVSPQFGSSTSEQPPAQPQDFSPYINSNSSIISSPPGSHGSSITTSSTPTLYSDSEPDVLQGYEDLNQWTQTPEYFDANEPMVVINDEELQHERSRAAMSVPVEALASRPILPSIRSFDRPPLRHVVSDMVTPQTDSNMGCAHAAPIYVEVGRESPLAYVALDQPWNAINASHWDFVTDGVVGA